MTNPRPNAIPLALLCGLILTPTAAGDDVAVQVRKNVMMPARDGVRLATDVYLPGKFETGPSIGGDGILYAAVGKTLFKITD